MSRRASMRFLETCIRAARTGEEQVDLTPNHCTERQNQ